MKKLLALLMTLVFIFTFAACGSKNDVTAETSTTTPAATISPADAKAATENFFKTLNTNKILELNGEETNAFTAEEQLFVVVLDAIVLNSNYEILSTSKKDNETFEVNVKISVPDAEAAMNIIVKAAETLDQKYSDATQDNILKIAKDLFTKAIADSNIEKKSAEILTTVKVVEGKCVVDTPDEYASKLSSIYFETLLDT